MKVGILSDIHGNHQALSAVLNEARLLKVEFLFILGDLIGYYYHPDKVLEMLNDWPKEMIQGNHEGMLSSAIQDENMVNEVTKKYGNGLNSALNQLSSQQINELTELPVSKKINFEGLFIELCHGSPWDRDYYIYPDAPSEILEKCATSGVDYVFMGHTHYPFFSRHRNTMILNVGSVGQARDKGGMASWVLFDTLKQVLVFKHTIYDVSKLVEEIKVINPNLPYLYEVLLRK